MTLSTLESEVKKVGHDIVIAAKAIEGTAVKAGAIIANNEGLVNTLLEDVDPAAAQFAEFGENLASKVIALIADAGSAASAGGKNLPLDETIIAEAKALWAAFKSKTAAVAAAAPATTSTPAS